MANYFLLCSEEMLGESPCAGDDAQMAAKVREQRQLSDQLETVMCKPLVAFPDEKILQDPRALDNMLKLEKDAVARGLICRPPYFSSIQSEVTPQMRHTVTMWLFEVCEEEKMEPSVFLRAVQQLDAFLGKVKVLRSQLQLAATVCLLISSKLAGTTISVQTLVSYTAYGVTTEQLLQWEGMILSTLHWDVYEVVACDFVPHILVRLPNSFWDNEGVRERIKLFIAFATTDHIFMTYPPSFLASAAIGSALAPPFIGPEAFEEILISIQFAAKIEINFLKDSIQKIKGSVEGYCSDAKKARTEEEVGKENYNGN